MQLLEREAQLQSLRDALREARSGHGCVALISGEAGIGKTSLVENFLQAQANSWRILRGTCDSLFTPRPLGPLHDIALQTGGTLLQRLESRSDRNSIFSASLSELQSQPTIVVVEDIHWADEATLDLLKYLGRRVSQSSTLMILTYRDDELGADHPLRQLVGDLGSSHSLRRIAVSPLSSAAVQELARNSKVDPLELHRLTNGNPFYVTEVLATQGGIPETIRDAVLARAGGLSPSARGVLEAGAVIGMRIEPWLLGSLVDLEPIPIEACLAAGLLRAEGSAYMFRHELTRQTILESISPHTMLALHRRALAALRNKSITRENLARLAYHAEATQDGELVLEFAPAAAHEASAASSHREAAALLRLALRFADTLPAHLHAHLLDEYVVELAFSGAFVDCMEACQRAVDLWQAANEPAHQGDSLANLAILLFLSGNMVEAQQAMMRAISILEAIEYGPELGRAYKAACLIRMEVRDLEEARRLGSMAIDLAEQFGDMDTLARACNYTACATMPDDIEAGRELMERSLKLAQRANMPFAVGGAYTNLVQMLLELFRLSEAKAVLPQGIAYAQNHDDDYHFNGLRTLDGLAAFWEGRWTEARSKLREVLEVRGPDLATRAYAQLTLAQTSIREGRESAMGELEKAVSAARLLEHLTALRRIHAAVAERAWLSGSLPEALGQLRLAYALAEGKKLAWLTGELAFWRWRAGDIFTPPSWTASPYALQIAGDWKAAAGQWAQRGCPYEQGMALMDGDGPAQLEALHIFEHLGAKPIAEKLKQQMRLQGVRGIPRGPRPSTRENALGLTARELEVLSALVSGSSNSAIAKQLSLSTRTVEHHLASIFQKTGTQSRGEAVALALREKLVPPY